MIVSLFYILIPFIICYAITKAIINKFKTNDWYKKLTQPAYLLWLLITWSMLGFATNNDYTLQEGCFSANESVFSRENLLFTVITLALLTLALRIKLRIPVTIILMLELFIWLFKLLIIKGGYEIGIVGTPEISVLFFDIVALFLRLALIKKLAGFKFPVIYVWVPVFFTLWLRITFF